MSVHILKIILILRKLQKIGKILEKHREKHREFENFKIGKLKSRKHAKKKLLRNIDGFVFDV